MAATAAPANPAGSNHPETFYDFLRQSAKRLDFHLSADRFPELGDLLKRAPPNSDSTRTGYGNEKQEHWPVLERERMIPLPSSLYEQYDLLQCKCFMGLFPEINRAWLTIDHRLYLWNYEDPTDFIAYDEQDQVIISVGLAKAAPGVFLEQIEYVLVITTPVDIFLLGLAFAQPATHDPPSLPRGPLKIYPTGLSLPSDNIAMTSVVGTKAGRIFMCGANGHLYELLYQSEEGWFARKCRKTNHTSSAYDMFVPTFLRRRQDDAITSVTVDDTRNVLYILSFNSTIEVVYLGADGKSFIRRGKITDLYVHTQKALESFPYSSYLEQRTFQVISIHAILPSESAYLHLVAVTSSGCRIYLSYYTEWFKYGDQQTMPEPSPVLRFAFVRPPPTVYQQRHSSSSLGFRGGTSPNAQLGSGSAMAMRIHEASYSLGGVTIMANAVSEEVDWLVGVSPDMGILSQSNHWGELSNLVTVEGKTWAIAEIPDVHTRLRGSDRRRVAAESGAILNELASQLEIPRRRFLVLTNSGITLLHKVRPIDTLTQALHESTGQYTPRMKAFLDSYGFDQTCAMLLAIICGHPSLLTKERVGPVNAAKRFYMDNGGKPSLRDRTSVNGNGYDVGGGSLGIPLASPEVEYSGRHNGLAIYLARLVKPIWKQKIVKKSPAPGFRDRLDSNIGREELSAVEQNLRMLDAFLKSVNITAEPNPMDWETGLAPQVNQQAFQIEQQSMHGLHQLLRQCLEAIQLMILLQDYKLPSLIQSLGDASRKDVADQSFETLTTTPKGRETAKMLINALVNKKIDENVGMDAIGNVLKMHCPTFCTDHDINLYKGVEHLQRAKTVQTQQERDVHLRESVRLFKMSESMNFDRLLEICENYKSLRFHSEAIELVLHFAQREDPGGLATQYLDDGFGTQDVVRAEAYSKRKNCYDLVTNIIDSITVLVNQTQPNGAKWGVSEVEEYRKHVVDRALSSSSDRLFHETMYDWYIRIGAVNFLLEIRSPFLEEYLRRRDDHNMIKADLLWEYYVRNNQFMKAARVLSHRASQPDPNLGLAKRVELLTRAVANAKSAGSSARADELDDMQERLEVATVQVEVYNAICTMPGTEDYQARLESVLLELMPLYNIAKGLRLSELVLQILHVARHNDHNLVEATWTDIKTRAVEESIANGLRPFAGLAEKVKALGQRYFPHDMMVFPVATLVKMFETDTFQRREKADRGWVIRTMRQVGVGYGLLFQIYHELFETRLPPWQSNDALAYLIENIAQLLNDWFGSIAHLSASDEERLQFPAQFIDDATSKYLVTLPDSRQDLQRSLQTIQGLIRKRFG